MFCRLCGQRRSCIHVSHGDFKSTLTLFFLAYTGGLLPFADGLFVLPSLFGHLIGILTLFFTLYKQFVTPFFRIRIRLLSCALGLSSGLLVFLPLRLFLLADSFFLLRRTLLLGHLLLAQTVLLPDTRLFLAVLFLQHLLHLFLGACRGKHVLIHHCNLCFLRMHSQIIRRKKFRFFASKCIVFLVIIFVLY